MLNAIITAGGIPTEDESLYKYSLGESKALIDLGGKPMVQWIVDALDGSKHVNQIVIVGIDERAGLKSTKPLHYVDNQGGMLTNLKAGSDKAVSLNPEHEHILLVSSDIPSLTTEIVNSVVETTFDSDYDMYYNVIEKSVMEKRFPGSARTFTKLKGLEVCGSDINVIKSWTIVAKEGLWTKLSEVRKSVLKQALLVGLDTMLLLLFRLLDLESAGKQASKKLGINVKLMLSPYAEIAMDVDKAHQFDVLAKDLL
jgi:CTP:molybdopterin cytidylyltransferase MocA